MKFKTFIRKSIVLIGLSILFSSANAAVVTFNAKSGNWSLGSNWSSGTVPTSVDDVIIPGDATVTGNLTTTVASISIGSGPKQAILNINSGVTITVTGVCSLVRANNNGVTNTLNVGPGNLTCGSLFYENGTANRGLETTISTGTLTVNGNITFNGPAAGNMITFSGSGTLSVAGNITSGTNESATLSASTGTFNYSANSNQNIFSFTGSYYNITLSGTATKTLTTGTSFALSSGSTLTVASGTTLDLSGNTITCASGTANVTINGTVQTNNTNGLYGASAAISNTNINTPTFGTSSTVIYNSSSAQNISALTYNNLTLSNGTLKSLLGSVTVSGTLTNNTTELSIGSNTLTINGAYAGSGTLTGSSTSNLTIGGTGASTTVNFTQTNSTTRTLNNLTLTRTNGATLGNAVEVIGTVSVSNGTLASGGNLTLISNASGTARVASITSGGISGNVTVQRFIPGGTGKRRWRFLSSPVNVSGSIALTQIIDDIHVTGTGGTANGFDDCSFCSASLRTYNEALTGSANTGWTNPATINTTIPTGTGFEVFVRGDRTLQDPFLGTTVPNDATIDYTGTLNAGNFNFNLSFTNTGTTTADGFNLVANPYASQIDWMAASGWTRTNLQAHAWVYNANTGSYGIISTSGATTGDVNITRYIPSGQAFFVKANAASPVLGMTESIKVTNTPFNYFRNAASPSLGFARFKLASPNYEDNMTIRLDTAAKDSAGDFDDAYKIFNDRLNFYTKSAEGFNLGINHYPYPDSIDIEDTINVSLFSYNDSTIEYTKHTIFLEQLYELDGDIRFDLLDHYTNQRIDLVNQRRYDFFIDTNTSSYGNNRFDIIVYRIFTGIKSEKINKMIKVYPNPSSDVFYIANKTLLEELVNITLSDIKGNIIYETKLNLNTEKSFIDLKEFSNGIYMLKVSGKNYNETHKLIKTSNE